MPTALRLCLVACALGIASLCHADMPQAGLPLTPVFFNTQEQTDRGYGVNNGPQLAFTYTNDTGEVINTVMALLHSTVVLDGETDVRVSVTGNIKLSPGQTWNSDFRLADYLVEYAKAGGKWSSAILADGPHTLTFKMGGKTYGPTTFIWKSSVAQSSVGPPLPPFTLVPIFFNTQGHSAETIRANNGPQYAYRPANIEQSPAGISSVPGQYYRAEMSFLMSAPLLDGKVYGYAGTRAELPGKQFRTILLSIKAVSPTGALAEGSHALAYTIDGKIYGPVTFIWHTQAP